MNVSEIKSFLRLHSIALVFSLVVGVLSVLPTVLAPLSIGDEYKGIQFLYLNDETTYRSRIHEILDGYPSVASPFLYEYKNGASIVPPINEFFYAIPALAFGLSGAIIFAKFFFPLILFALVYFLVYGLLSSIALQTRRLVAIAAGVLITLGYDLVDIPLLQSILLGDVRSHLLIWTRLVNPITGVLLSFSTFLLSWKIFQGKLGVRGVILAIPLALSVGYFFSFGVSYAFVGMLTIISLAQREYKIASIFLLAVLVSFVLDASYWYQLLTSMSGEEGRALSLKNGMYFTHQIVVNKIVLLSTLAAGGLFIFQRYVRVNDVRTVVREWQFIAALIATAWIVFGQQVVTGRTVWADHFVQFTIPMMIVALFVGGTIVFSARIPKTWTLLVSSVIFVSVTFGVYSTASYRWEISDYSRQQESYGEIVSWLNLHAEPDCVVLSREWNEEFERLLPGYTHCNVYNTQYAYSVVPKERVLDNFLLRLRLIGVSSRDVESYLYADENDVRGYFFENWDQLYMKTQGRDEWLTAKVAYLTDEYNRFLKEDLSGQIRKYKVDYIYAEDPFSEKMLDEISGISVATSTENFILYRLDSPLFGN